MSCGTITKTNGGGYGFAAVSEFLSGVPKIQRLVNDGIVEWEDYFNADVFLFRPKFFQDNLEKILDACKFVYEHGYHLNEQDALNYLFSKNYTRLPRKFNTLVKWVRQGDSPVLEKAIFHFVGAFIGKPELDTDDISNRLYWEYFLKTPFATAEMFGNIDKAIKDMLHGNHNSSKEMLLYFTNLVAHRRRAFLVEKNNVDAVKNIFAVKEDELMIDVTQPDAGKILLEEIQKTRGQRTFFVFLANYAQVAQFLLQHNFTEGADFINAMLFLSERHGFKVDFDTKPIVQAV